MILKQIVEVYHLHYNVFSIKTKAGEFIYDLDDLGIIWLLSNGSIGIPNSVCESNRKATTAWNFLFGEQGGFFVGGIHLDSKTDLDDASMMFLLNFEVGVLQEQNVLRHDAFTFIGEKSFAKNGILFETWHQW